MSPDVRISLTLSKAGAEFFLGTFQGTTLVALRAAWTSSELGGVEISIFHTSQKNGKIKNFER